MTAVDKFRQRFGKLWESWKSGTANGFSGSCAMLVATGVFGADEDIGYLKSFALVTWLFGAELQGCAVVLSKTTATLVFQNDDFPAFTPLSSSAKDGLPEINVLNATPIDKVKDAFEKAIAGDGSLAVLTKEIPNSEGPVAELVAKLSKAGTPVNVAPALAVVLAVKDEEEELRVKKASILSAHVMKTSLTEKIEKTIDMDRKVRHTTLSEIAEDAIMNPSKLKVPLKADFCDPCYPPIIQSADAKSPDRKFDLRPSAASSSEHLRFGCIVASIGARFNFYCSNISRTLLVNPSKTQEAVYDVVLAAQTAAIRALIPGSPLKVAYAAALQAIEKGTEEKKKKGFAMPNLITACAKNVGFGMGIEFRDSAHVLNVKNENKVKKGMVYNVSVGVQDLKDPENGMYAVLIGDTVHTRESKLGPDIFTSASRKDFKHISYFIGNEEDEEDNVEEVDVSKSRRTNGHALAENDGGRSRRRAAIDATQAAGTEEEDQKRRKHQEALAKKMLDRGRARLQGGDILTVDDAQVTKKKQLDEFRAYASIADFPKLKAQTIMVDMEAEAIIVPINGIPVPFHISTLKNANKSDEGQYSYLRINFHIPQTGGGRGIGRVSDNAPKFPEFDVSDGSSTAFVKEFTFRSSNPINLNDCLRKIKELRKRATEKATTAIAKQSLVTQQSLVLERGRRPFSLQSVSVRPPMAKGKNNVGHLEAHTNGFRYRCRSGSIDIIYANIRNAFFQEANRELLVVIHFHLKNDIMVGTKKTKDVQFYVQVMEAVVKLNENRRRRQFDQDELEEEQRERDLRNRTNRNFLKFTKDVEERYGLEFDLPYRQLQFTGAPKSVSVTLLPTVSCIVNLTEWPPCVLNLEDVEVAHFERVIFQLRMFDVVFVFKGFEDDPAASGKAAKDMWMRISSIPMEELTPLKRYLDEQNIKYYEGKASLQWNEVLKSIRNDLGQFYEDGGWNFLSLDGPTDFDGADPSDEDVDSLEGDAEFEPSQSEEAYGSEDESSDADSGSDASDAVKELEGNSDEGEVELSSDEEGLDWEELERKAQADDLRKGRTSDDDNDNRSRRRNAGRSRPSGSSNRRPSGSSNRRPTSSGKKRSRRER
ncbi:unnamed protein product [Chondrus crispus]|uniref:FACT complex subunit n=1 Tax=Chondrus crispus TaxID=2769 RepID=R7QRF8_CHOCR|nr:unnamed protein product [Chondrus crispus]CDF41067.1 unnamed protein product [Chondrus crispus]|eukprot:XP_005711361.1 unnamed protein product [Chondrus crispus]